MEADKNYKKAWIKLVGPSAGTLEKVFSKSSVVVWPDFMTEESGKKDVTGQEEDTSNRPQTGEKYSVRVGAEGIKPKTEPPTKIIITGAEGAKKCINVLRSYRIVLLGETGAGKSSLANKIFEENVFQLNKTSTSQVHSKSVHERRITVVDTPGFFDADQPENKLEDEIVKHTTRCSPGPHAFLIVLKVEKSIEQQQGFIKKIRQYFPEEAFKYAAVVFTCGDQLCKEEIIKQYISKNKYLSDLVQKCSNRYHVVDNECSQEGDNISQLHSTIDEIVKENKGGCYTNKMLQAPKREKGNTKGGNLSPGENGNKTNSGSNNNLWINFSGPAGNSVAKAFFGLSVASWHEAQESTEEAKYIKKTSRDENEGENGATATESETTKTSTKIKEKIEQLTHLYNMMKQNLGVILLVVAFYLLLVLSFCARVAMAGTFLLSGGVLVMFLLIVLLLTAILQ